MFKLLIYTVIIFLQAALVKACASADKVILKEGAVVEKALIRDAQVLKEAQVLKSIYKITEADIKIFKQAKESLSIVEKNEKIAFEFSAVKKDRSEKFKDIVDLIPTPDNSAYNKSYETLEVYVNEIKSSQYFLPVCKLVRYNFENENLNNDEVTYLLKGNKIDTLQIKPESLFNIYYMYSKKFSEKVLIQVALKVNCDNVKIEQIKQIAEAKGITSNSLLFRVLSKCK